MGLDTENKRRSATSFLLVSVLPVADGNIDMGDLAHVTGVYCGLFPADSMMVVLAGLVSSGGIGVAPSMPQVRIG